MERLCDGRFPGFGYAVLASLVAQPGGCFNVVLTTNFDDLVADSLYLFTEARPLVIPHESLASYIRPTRTRPLVVKMHGDHRLSPQNTGAEIEKLKEGIEKQVSALLHDRGLIFVGYGGNDKGIASMLETLPTEALPFGAFWVSGEEPRGKVRPWLETRNAIWVEAGDFDELMLLVRDACDLTHPNRNRFDSVFQRYFDTYKKLWDGIASRPDASAETTALKQAVERADQSFPDAWSAIAAAQRAEKDDPDHTEAIYEQAVQQFPTASALLGSYSIFLTDVRKDQDRAEELFKRAIQADPNHANNLGNYALFLKDIRKNHDEAEKLYRKALDIDPNHANNLGSYALFLWQVRKDQDRAEDFYKRAIQADPNHANNLGSYAGFLLALGSRADGLMILARVISLPAFGESGDLAVECWFYAYAHRPPEIRAEALQLLKKALLSGARSPGWDLSQNIARAREDGHPEGEWLEKLAAVITEEADIGILDEWEAWRNA